uniref:ATPase with chaperone activity-like protein n=1 Tax=Solibacter usitatus (strain Ellin6076) TaxID=234267 RepID=Q01XC8_SOLUE
MIAPLYVPREPDCLQATGLAESTLEALILKILYFRGDLYGQELSTAIGLRFSVIEEIVEALKQAHHIQIKKSLGMGTIGSTLALTETGRARAREALEANQYAGPAPVPLGQYIEVVRAQRQPDGWLNKASLARAFRGMVMTENLLTQVGPAVSAANSLLVYGKPGDGKTFLIESLSKVDSAPVFVPHAIECQGNIVLVYDPIDHHRVEEEEEEGPAVAIAREAPFDRRWVKCKRPFLMSGGELALDMLDLRYNGNSKVYDAPFQLKANNGIYLVDDFGRQRATPAELLNRWIVPMERRVDYLSFVSGGKMTTPFETFLVFSTNLNPADLGDEAFLRRLQYKIRLRGPAHNEFVRIFENACRERKLPCAPELLQGFLEKRYHQPGKAFRRCHPRDLLTHALNLIHFENLPYELTAEVLDQAFESCFLQGADDDAPAESKILRASSKPCADYWAGRTQAFTLFGRLAFLASCREHSTGHYRDQEALREFDAAEISSTLAALHIRVFVEWLSLNLDQQSRDLARYLSTPEGRAAFLSFDRRELTGILAPPDTKPQERRMFNNDLTTVLLALSQPHHQAEAVAPSQIERIA